MNAKRDTKHQNGREKLLMVARNLFTRRGFSNVGINEVTATAGVARMTLYNNFASKGELILAVYREMISETLSDLEEFPILHMTEEQRIYRIFDHFGSRTDDQHFRGCPFIQASHQAIDSHSGVFVLIRDYKRSLRGHLHAALDANRANRDRLADQLLLLLDGAVTEAYIGGVWESIEAGKHAAGTLLRADSI
jgi:AcrR family transcriptional regulator